jgi:hypothetical protein
MALFSGFRIPGAEILRLVGLSALLWHSCVTASGLQWETTRRDLTALAGDPEAVGFFPFKNTSSSPVTITHLVTSCDCTVATASPTTLQPGQSGMIRAALKIGDRLGRQEKTIEVTTNDEPTRTTQLILHVTVAEIITCEPRTVQWRQDDLNDERMVTFVAIPPYKIRALAPPSDTGGFSCTVEKKSGSDTYVLKIKPSPNAVPMRRVLQFSADVEGRPPLSVAVYALIQPPASRQ